MLGCLTASEMGGMSVQITGPRGSEGGPQPNYVAYVFVFLSTIIVCQLYTLTLSYQA
jgi:hypothetical protein